MDQSPKPKLRPKLRLSYDDLQKIERVVNEEAKGEGVEGRNAIRGVIFNRLMSERFPDSVDEVLSPREFEPVGKYGSINKIPVDEDILNERLTEMADYIQYGEDASKGSTFFLNKKLAKKRKTDFGGKGGMTIGNHTFYKSYEGQEPVEDVNFSHNVEVYYEGYDAGGFVSKFMDMVTSPLTGDYRKEKPLSVEAADTAVSLTTPIDSIVEIQEELKKDEPDYLKIGMLGGIEALSLVGPAIAPAARTMIRKGADMAQQTDEAVEVASSVPKVSNKAFKKTVKAYKLFTKGEDGKLYPLFVDADTEVPVGQYLKAVFPEYRFKAENGNFYVPSRGTAGKKGTGDSIKIPDQETRDMLIEAGFLPKGSKAKTIKAVAARPGWHAGDTPMAKHIGPEVEIDGKKYKVRGQDQVWAEVEMPADTDWQAIADSRAVMKKDGTPNVKTAHITDELPFGGYYRYKTNPNMEGQWLISGDMKVNRVLDRDEVKRLNAEAGFEDLPTEAELREQLGNGFAAGGLTGEDMYQGVDDYQMAEMGAGMKEGGMMFKSSRGMAMNEGGDIGETVGVDPVSGNEIPLGSTAENVRDDIPAQLSEGEYVVPADVVRYYGVKFFEDLRTEAKVGFQQMQENGRIGGEPVGMEMAGDELPFDISELQMSDDGEGQPMMAAGGYMKAYAPGGFETDMYSPSTYQPGGSMAGGNMGMGGLEVIKYVHPDGREIFVQFMGGSPLTMIPEGFEPEETAAEQVSQGVSEQVTRTGSDDDDNTPPIEPPEPIEWSTEATLEDFQNYAKKSSSFGKKAIAVGAGMVAGLPGSALVRMAQKMEDSRVREGLKDQIEAANEAGDTKKSAALQAVLESMNAKSDKSDKDDDGKGIFGGKSSLYEDLESMADPTEQGDFGDTWLGDLLGFDDNGIGVQGDSLADSLGGSRRDGQQSTSTATSTSTPSQSSDKSSSKIGTDAGDGMTWVKMENSNALTRVRDDDSRADFANDPVYDEDE
jgi:hypothetical protein